MLLGLLPSCLGSIPLCQSLMLLLLALLKFLAFLILFIKQLFLLLLVLAIAVGIAGTSRRRAVDRRQILGVNRGTICSVLAAGWRGGILRSAWSSTAVATVGGRLVGSSGCSGGHSGVKLCRPGSSGDGRLAPVGRGVQLRVRASRLKMLSLRCRRREMRLTCGSLFFGAGTRLDASGTAVVTDMSDVGDIHVLDINIANHSLVDVHYGTVVVEAAALPSSAHKALTEIAEAINDSSVESDLRTPPAFVKKIRTVRPAPPRRRPQITDLGGQDPGA